MEKSSRTRSLLIALTFALSFFGAVSGSTAPLYEGDNLRSQPFNENREGAQTAIDVHERAFPLIGNDVSAPKNEMLSGQVKSVPRSRFGNARYLRSNLLGPLVESVLTKGGHQKMRTSSRQVGTLATVRGTKSVYSISYGGDPPAEIRQAFEYAVRMWANTFECSVVLRVFFRWQNLGGRTLAAANSPFTILGRGGSSKLRRNTAYTPTLAAAIAGRDFVPSKHHIEISFNSRQPWHYDLSSAAPTDMFDLPTVALHELCHALFFSGALLGRTMTRQAQFVSARSKPGRFDQFMQTSAGVGIARSCNATELFQAITTPGLRFRTTTGNSSFALYAPQNYSPGASTYHFDAAQLPRDCAAFGIPPGECSDLMTVDLDAGYTRRTIGEPVLRVMRSVLGQNSGLRRSEECKITNCNERGCSGDATNVVVVPKPATRSENWGPCVSF